MATRSQSTGGTRVLMRHVDFLVLAALGDECLHGYGIVRAIARLTDGRMSLRPGDVYRVLYRMQRRGLLEPAERRPAPESGAKRRTYYRLTARGERVAAEEAELMSTVAEQLLARAGKRIESAS